MQFRLQIPFTNGCPRIKSYLYQDPAQVLLPAYNTKLRPILHCNKSLTNEFTTQCKQSKGQTTTRDKDKHDGIVHAVGKKTTFKYARNTFPFQSTVVRQG